MMMVQVAKREGRSSIRNDDDFEQGLMEIVSLLIEGASDTEQFQTLWDDGVAYLEHRRRPIGAR